MVLFSDPDAVREIFRLDPAIAPAGQSWEFLRPFAGEQSILVLDGEEHLRERRLIQAPFHGERMRGFGPVVAELARAELAGWSGRVNTLERMKQLTLETHPARRLRRPRRTGGRRAARRRARHARQRPLAAAHAGDGARAARPRAAQPLGPLSACGRALRRSAARLRGAAAGASRAATRCSRCCSSSVTRPATRRPTGTCATSSWRCWPPATTPRRRRWPGPSSGSLATRGCTRACARATRPTSTRSSRRCCACDRR